MLEIHTLLFLGKYKYLLVQRVGVRLFLTCRVKPRVGNAPLPTGPAGVSRPPNLVAVLTTRSQAFSFVRPGKEVSRGPFPHWLCGVCSHLL